MFFYVWHPLSFQSLLLPVALNKRHPSMVATTIFSPNAASTPRHALFFIEQQTEKRVLLEVASPRDTALRWAFLEIYLVSCIYTSDPLDNVQQQSVPFSAVPATTTVSFNISRLWWFRRWGVLPTYLLIDICCRDYYSYHYIIDVLSVVQIKYVH